MATGSTAPFQRGRVAPSLFNENHAEVIVRHVARVAEREVRSDIPAGARKLPLASIDTPHHDARLEPGLRAIAKIAVLDRAESQAIVAVAKLDRAFLQK